VSEIDLPDHVRRNRAVWDRWAPEWVAPGERNWNDAEASWGVWRMPESELRMIEGVAGWTSSSWAAALPTSRPGWPAAALILSPSTYRLNSSGRPAVFKASTVWSSAAFGSAESVPLPDAGFDLAISEYGASIWADPYRWIPERLVS